MTKAEHNLREEKRRRALVKDALIQDGALIGLTPEQAEEKIERYYQKMLQTIDNVKFQLDIAKANGFSPQKVVIKDGDNIEIENIAELRYPA